MNTVAIIPARGGSKRIPRKNVKDFCGKPLVAWSILQAVNSVYVNDVIVNTDDAEIEGIASELGATVVRRPPEDDGRQAGAVLVDTIEAIELGLVKSIPKIDSVVSLLPTSPVRLPWDIDAMVHQFLTTHADRVISACEQLETLLYEKTGGDTARLVLFDKFGSYWVDGGGMGVGDVRHYKESAKSQPTSDAEIDNNPLEVLPRHYHIYAMKEWQTPELDTPDHWEQAEAIMEKCILEKYGRDCYGRYNGA